MLHGGRPGYVKPSLRKLQRAKRMRLMTYITESQQHVELRRDHYGFARGDNRRRRRSGRLFGAALRTL